MYKKREKKISSGSFKKYILMVLMIIMVSLFLASTAHAKQCNWVLQGEITTFPTVVPQHPLELNINYYVNSSGNLCFISNNHAELDIDHCNENLAWGTASEGGVEYKLVWKAKSVSGSAFIEHHLLPSGSWSQEYETKGRTLNWEGDKSNKIEFEYIKLYARDSYFYDNAILAQWDFTNGMAVDATGNGNNGTYTGTIPTNIPGKTGQGLSLDGNSFMTVPASSNLYTGNEDFSVSLWYKSSSQPAGNYTLIDKTYTSPYDGKTSGYSIKGYRSEADVILHIDGKTCQFSTSDVIIFDGIWHNIALVLNKGVDSYDVVIYLDGKRMGYSKLSPNTNATTSGEGVLYIGKKGFIGFIGVIDDVTIYNKALSYNDIINISEAAPDTVSNVLKKYCALDINANENFVDFSDNQNTGVYSKSAPPTYVQSKTEPLGKAIQFDGQNYLQVTNSASLNFGTEDFSISCWFKTTNQSMTNTILDKRTKVNNSMLGYHLCIFNENEILFQMADAQRGFFNYRGAAGLNLNDGNWHFAAVSVDRDNTQGVKIYIDGNLKYSGNATYRPYSINNSANLLIGKHIERTIDNFNGAIDEVKLFRKALSDAEVNKIYGKKKWNVILYLNGDNNLNGQQLLKLNDYEVTGSNDDVNVLALLDRSEIGYEGYEKSWAGTRLYYVTKDPHSDYCNASRLLKDYGELDMSNPDSLEDFITYCQKNYPADKTFVAIANHGEGIYGISQDDTSDSNIMKITQLKQAISNARAATNQKIDILYFDACLMQMAEIVYQLRNDADYIVGSEAVTFGISFKEKEFYAEFVKNTSKSPEDITKLFRQFSGGWTLSGIKTKDGAMSSFVTAFNNFSTLLAAKSDFTDIKAAYAETPNIPGSNIYIDLINFSENVAAKTTDINIKNSVAALKTAFNNCIVFNVVDDCPANGLSIYFPESIYELSAVKRFYSYTNAGYDFLNSTQWDEFLGKYLESLI